MTEEEIDKLEEAIGNATNAEYVSALTQTMMRMVDTLKNPRSPWSDRRCAEFCLRTLKQELDLKNIKS